MAGTRMTKAQGALGAGPARVNPNREVGVSGTPIYGGYVRSTDTNYKLQGRQRWVTAADLLTNVAIVASGVRYFLNLVSKPSWKVVPADDTGPAKQSADLVESVLFGMQTAWPRVIRRQGMFRFHGANLAEWTAMRRDDGKIGLKDIEQRPMHTIERWATDPQGGVTGVWQRNPQNGAEIWIPRSKLVYLVDDMMTDSPEGLGWFRALAPVADRLKAYKRLEQIGYERNLGGTPIGRVPLGEIASAVAASEITQADADKLKAGMAEFVRIMTKEPNTSLTLDSAVYENVNETGTSASNVKKWDVDLLKGDLTGMEELAVAIDREMHELARIMGVASLLLGQNGKGSLALSKTDSENLYLVVNSTVQDMAESMNRDAIGPVCDLNGIPDKLRPTLRAEDVAFKDVVEMSEALLNMANAGAVLAPNDPAINEIRSLMGLSDAPKMDEVAMAMGVAPGAKPGSGGADAPPGSDKTDAQGKPTGKPPLPGQDQP